MINCVRLPVQAHRSNYSVVSVPNTTNINV